MVESNGKIPERSVIQGNGENKGAHFFALFLQNWPKDDKYWTVKFSMWSVKYNLNVLFLDHNKPFEMQGVQYGGWLSTIIFTIITGNTQ